MTYPCDWMVRDHNLKADNDLKQARLMYWQRLRGARLEYASEKGSDHRRVVAIEDDFYFWMINKYGIQLEFVDGNISGAYTIVDENLFLIFLIKYPA